MMVTIRHIAACIGLSDSPLSVRGLFGDAAPPVSVRVLAAQKTQKKIDLNVVLVGWESFVFPGGLSQIEEALALLRIIYAQVDLGIGKVSVFFIPLDEAEGHEHIESEEESDIVEATWGFAGKAIDVFFVLSWAGPTVGRSPIDGPCPKSDEPESGLVVAIEGPVGITLAHELAHYLGLNFGMGDPAPGDPLHSGDPENLMFPDVPNGAKLTKEQGDRMKKHCMVYTGCRPLP